MDITGTVISIGLEKPFRALHISDSHIAFADGRDGERKTELAKKRFAFFDRAPEYLDEQLAYAKNEGIPILYTGDFCDFVSYRNLEYAKEKLWDTDHFLAVGNHEFSLYVGEAFEDVPYMMQSYGLVQRYFRYNLLFDSRVIGGVNFVGVNNGYYQFDASQREKLRLEIEKGLPIVLLMHNPLYTEDLYAFSMQVHASQQVAYLTGTPDDLMRGYSEYRFRQQHAEPETLAFIDFVYSQPLIRAVLAGHIHVNAETVLPSGIPQYIVGGGYKNLAREIMFV